ncbi:2',5'-phosphodiesterase 12-like [Panonychus citri]|uniref:2',5'-phosphodiesterase 12-like n=1 Tax=Panonychus citri TaxID=50023 RepID=UPI0023073D8F|nr:2',5'-phosphodiesterase 12-like [Panonychus citri]
MRTIFRCLSNRSLGLIVNSRIMSSLVNCDSTCSSQGTALLSMEPDCDKMSLRFTYCHNLNEKIFSLNRDKNESLAVAFSRLRLNLERFVNPITKKTKWTKQKNGSNQLIDESKQDNQKKLLEIKLIVDGQTIDLNTPHSQAWKDNSILIIGDSNYKVLLNSPMVESVKLSNCLLTGYIVYPVIYFVNATINDCDYSWYRFKSKSNCDSKKRQAATIEDNDEIAKELISTGFIYHVKNEDIGHHLMVKITPKDTRLAGLEGSCVSDDVVNCGPVDCPFMERQKLTSTRTDSESIRIITYNLLADYYTRMKTTPTEIFPYCPIEYLNFNYRKPLLIKELIGYNGDIICLQEVDRKFFDYELIEIFSKFNSMEGFFTRKSGREIKVPEGVAIFYSRDKFKLLDHCDHDLTELCLTDDNLTKFSQAVKCNQKLHERLIDRNTIVQYVLLETINSPGKGLLVINTHLYSNPDSDHIRLLQGSIIIVHVEKLLQDYSVKFPHLKISPIFTGDFNSDPANGVYKLFTNGYIGSDYVDWKSVPDEAIEGVEVKHSLQLTSAYGTPEFTNYTQNYVGCLDYIFFDNQLIQLESIVPLPSRDQVSKQIAIPSSVFPSDHLALIAVIKWK